MRWGVQIGESSLPHLIGLALQLLIALLAYLAARWLVRVCVRRYPIETVHPIFRVLVSLFPIALAASLAHCVSLAFEWSEYAAWMPYGSVALFAALVYLLGAKVIQLLTTPEAAKGYELTIWLPLVLILTAMYLSGTLPKVGSFISEPQLSIGGQKVSILSVLIAIAVILISLRLSGTIARCAYQISLSRYGLDEHAAHIITHVAKFSTLALGALIALDFLGVSLSTFKFFAGAFGLGLGFGMQQIANNLISGALLLAEKSIRVGDMISVAGQVGRVERIMARAIVIRAQDDRQVIIPNMQLLTAPVVRWSKDSPSCIRLSIGTAHIEDIDSLQALLREAVSLHPMVLSEPAVRVRLTRLSADALSFEVHAWVSAVGEEAAQVESELYRRLYEALKGAGVAIR
ncbi:MAG: hypothetical protein GDYSWBUE_000183 [Candidatus Fervidibacterota bacterium]